MAPYEIAGRTVLITGSTGGLGSAVARALRDRKANLALLDLDADATATQVAELGPEAVAKGWAVDVRDLDSVTAAVEAAADHFGRIDVVIAGAGVGSMAGMETLSPEIWDRVIDIDLSGVWRTFRAALPHVVATKGYLLAISSMAAFVHSPLNGPYVVAKAGVWALCDATRLEVRHHGVRVGSVHPTFFHTAMMDDTFADAAGTTLWGGNSKGVWKMVPLEDVVSGVVRGIERRSAMIVVPRSNTLFARMPGVVRPLVDRFLFSDSTIRDAIAKANETGWISPRVKL